MPRETVLIAGASGLVGHAAVRHFAGREGWRVIGLSRRTPQAVDGAEFLSIDLADAGACRRAAASFGDVTHLVYAALHEVPGLFAGWVEEEAIERNGAMLRNLFGPLSEAAPGLRHVSLLHGTKAYGIHHPSIGPRGVRIPLREREPRREHRNFYFVQEDYLREKQRGAAWGLTVFRPTVIYGDAWANNMNPIPVLAAYAALLREAGEPLHFPGRPGHQGLREAVDVDLVASALGWAAESPAAVGGTFNLTNGDVFVWDNVWPAIAGTMGMDVGGNLYVSLAEYLPAQQDRWSALVRRHALRAPEQILEFVGYNSLVYTDMLLGGAPAPSNPLLNSTIAARQAGFHDCMDSEDMFRKWFAKLQDEQVIPSAN